MKTTALIISSLCIITSACAGDEAVNIIQVSPEHSYTQVELLQGRWTAEDGSDCQKVWVFTGAAYSYSTTCIALSGGKNQMIQHGTFTVGEHYDGETSVVLKTTDTSCPSAGTYDGTDGPSFGASPLELLLTWDYSRERYVRSEDGFKSAEVIPSGCFTLEGFQEAAK